MERQFKAELNSLYPILEFIKNEVDPCGFSELVVNEIELALEELFANIVDYAYPNKAGLVIIDCHRSQNEKFVITVKDQGIAFNPLIELQKHPKTVEILRQGRGGYGIFIILSVMDKVDYQRDNGWNVLILEKSNQACLTDCSNRESSGFPG